MKKYHLKRRVLTVLLSFALVFTCVPLLGGNAFAAVPQPDSNGSFIVYPTYFNYYPYSSGGNRYGQNLYGSTRLYMEYSADGANWTRTGYMTCNMIQLPAQQGYMIGGLQPNTVYHTRIWYGDENGNQISPARPLPDIRTGMAAPPQIKKITAKAVKVKHHRVRHPAGYYWYGSVLVSQKAWTEKFYTYKVKVIVELKKKPGTAGIYINGQWVPGNKKKYKVTFSPYPNYSAKNPRGRIKWTVNVQSGMDPNYGGYSPVKTKTKKLK